MVSSFCRSEASTVILSGNWFGVSLRWGWVEILDAYPTREKSGRETENEKNGN